MSSFISFLPYIVTVILLGGLIYTLTTGTAVSARQSKYDTEINEKIQRHPYLLNPVFLSYIIGIGLMIIYIIYLSNTSNW